MQCLPNENIRVHLNIKWIKAVFLHPDFLNSHLSLVKKKKDTVLIFLNDIPAKQYILFQVKYRTSNIFTTFFLLIVGLIDVT